MTTPPGTALAVAPEPTRMALTESVSVAVAAQVKASVEARYLMALRQPRNWLDVRSKLLAECKRPAFAIAARYKKPIGNKSVEGASIRFVEAALRCMTNILVETPVLFDDDTQRIVRVTVSDLEANLSYQLDIHVAKTVERKTPREGQDVLGSRVNTQGGTVYIVRATEDDLIVKQAALISKAIRTLGERLLPADIRDDGMEVCIATEKASDAEDPKAALKKLVDAFDSIAVRPSELERFVGHPLDQTSPAEVRRLRAFFRAIEEGEATWAQILELAGPGVSEADKNKGATALRDAVKKNEVERAAAKADGAAATVEGQKAAEPKGAVKAKAGQKKARADADGVVVDEKAANLALDMEMEEADRAARKDAE